MLSKQSEKDIEKKGYVKYIYHQSFVAIYTSSRVLAVIVTTVLFVHSNSTKDIKPRQSLVPREETIRRVV